MEKGYLTEVKAILKSLVLSCTDKMTVDKLNREFRDIEGENIPYRRLGFDNIEQFLHSIPDTLKVFGSGPTAMVCFVANERSDHIHDMIMEQRKPKTKARRTRSNNPVGRSNNKFSNNNTQPRNMSRPHQFSAFQSTNKSHLTKRLTVRNIPPPLPTASNYSNHRPPCFDQKVSNDFYQLPQPAGINTKNLGSTHSPSNSLPKPLPKIEKQSISGGVSEKDKIPKLQEAQIKQLANHLNSSCHINTPAKVEPQLQLKTITPPLSAESQTKSELEFKTVTSPKIQSQSSAMPHWRVVTFSQETKTNKETKPKSPTVSEKSYNLNGIKPPSVGLKTVKPRIKLSEDVERLLSVPSSRPNLNPIQETSDPNENENANESATNLPTKIKQTINTASKNFFDLSTDQLDDEDEAIPQFAANNLVYRLDFPEHTVRYGRKIPPYVLSDDVFVGAYIRIFIAEIHSPFKFWFHIQREDHELDLLMYQIERFYKPLDADVLRIPMACLTPGQICAACFHDLWHRAEIVSPPVNNKIKVSFVDYGTVSDVDVKDVKFLASSFAQLPTQALRGCLSHIKPRFLHWTHEATKYFLSLVVELMLYAKITEIDRENQILYMIICNTHGDEDIQINSALVKQRYALLNDDWLENTIKKNKGQRLHHPREDFPTFSMIESGEYPSFGELVNLQERGIDYESIHDHVIFNKSAILNKHENAPEAIRKLPYPLMTTNPFRSDIMMELNGMMQQQQTAKAK